MALTQNNFVGFESGGLEELSNTAGSPVIVTTPVRTGNYALHLPEGANLAEIKPLLNTTDAGAKFIVGFAVRFTDVSPGAECRFFGSNGAVSIPIGLRLATDGDLELLDVGGIVVGTATTPFTVDTWHYIEVYWEHVDSGVAEVFVDGTQVIDVSAQDFLSASDFMVEYRWENFTSTTTSVYVDDIYCMSGATAASDRLGDGVGVYAYKHPKTGKTPDAGSGGTAGVDLDTAAWTETITGTNTGGGEYTGSGDRGTVDWNGPSAHGTAVDSGLYYADTSDAGPTDNDAVWGNESLAFNGSIITGEATTSTDGSRTTNELRGAGTNFPSSGDSFTNVKFRVFGNSSSFNFDMSCECWSDGEGELLGTITVGSGSGVVHWSPWVELTVPSGGWTRAKIQSLEFICWKGSGGTGTASASLIQVTTTKPVANDADIIATKALVKLNRDGGAGTTHIIGLSHSGDVNNATEFDDDNDWGPITTTRTWYEVIQAASGKVPKATENIRAGFGTLGAQDIHMYDGYAMLLHVEPAGAVEIPFLPYYPKQTNILKRI